MTPKIIFGCEIWFTALQRGIERCPHRTQIGNVIGMSPTTAEIERRSTPAPLTAAQHDEINHVGRQRARQAEPRNTAMAYDKDWKVWQTYCREKNLRDDETSEGLLVAFAEWMCERRMPATEQYPFGKPYAPATLRRHLAGVIVRQRMNLGVIQVPKGMSDAAAKILSGYERQLKLARVKTGRGRAPALWQQQFTQLCEHLDLDTAIGKRDLALFLMWYYTGSRRAEMASLDVDDVEETDEGLELNLLATKTGDRAPIVPHDHPPGMCSHLCPVGAWHAWRGAAAASSGPAFLRIDRHGNIYTQGMSGAAIAERLKLCCTRAGLPPGFKGHSMRRGHISVARSQGKDAAAISRQTGHVPGSAALQLYFEAVDKWTDTSAHGLLPPLQPT